MCNSSSSCGFAAGAGRTLNKESGLPGVSSWRDNPVLTLPLLGKAAEKPSALPLGRGYIMGPHVYHREPAPLTWPLPILALFQVPD